MKPRISLIIPTFNRIVSLKRTIGGLEDQGIPCSDFEVIVSVDGSQDGTVEYLAEKAMSAPWLHPLPGSGRRGAGAARNMGAAMARGDVLLFLDDDVLPSRALIGGHLAAHREGKPLVVLGRVLADHGTSPWDRLITEEIDRQRGKKRKRAIYFSSSLFSVPRPLFLDAGGFSEDMSIAPREDREFSWRLHKKGIPMIIERSSPGWHLRHLPSHDAARLFFESGKALVATLRMHPDMLTDPFFGPSARLFLSRMRGFLASGTPSKKEDLARGRALDRKGIFASDTIRREAWNLLFRWQIRGGLQPLGLASEERPRKFAVREAPMALFAPRPDLRGISMAGRMGFLFIGNEGATDEIAAIIDCFCRAFSSSDPVFLILWLRNEGDREVLIDLCKANRETCGDVPPPIIVILGALRALERLHLYNEADFYIHGAGESGGFLVEAMACARGVISYGRGKVKGIIDGERALITRGIMGLPDALRLAVLHPVELERKGMKARQWLVAGGGAGHIGNPLGED
jgi:GT2 family glycosyltransferase